MDKKPLLTPVLPSWVILITACHVWPEILPHVLKNRRTQFVLMRQHTKSRSFRSVLRKPNLGSFSNELFWVCCWNKTARMPNNDTTTTKSGMMLALNMDPSTCWRVALSTILNSSGKLWTTTFFENIGMG